MNVIDFHNHYYPPEYLEAIQKGQHHQAFGFVKHTPLFLLGERGVFSFV